ncbi:MAG: 5'-3' exonuclease H3TH domain-containing protein [Patescibacteria group bacterium]
MTDNKDILLLVDAHALIYRAFYAFPELNMKDGILVNAVYGFSRILLKVLKDFDPKYVAICFDHKEKTFRAKSYEGYKANRKEMPDELKPQIDLVKQVVDALNIPRFEIAGYEADDLIGSLSAQASKFQAANNKLRTIIVTGDKDMLQLVTDKVHVFIPSRSKKRADTEYDPAIVEQELSITPEQVIDMKALMGDPSDNVPGIKGIGQKTATKLIQEFSSIENLYKNINSENKLLRGSVLEKLKSSKQDAIMSKELVTINRGAPIKLDLEKCRINGYDKEEAAALFEEFEFESLIKMLPKDDFEIGLQEALF